MVEMGEEFVRRGKGDGRGGEGGEGGEGEREGEGGVRHG